MCGVAGILKLESTSCAAAALERMRDEVYYRGPDDLGSAYFRKGGMLCETVDPMSANWTVALAHRRLSILDLSPSGHQPMSYQDRYWIVYNGEVYNYVELRQELMQRGKSFQSSSDTEVILAAYAQWGSSCFARFRGMWGLILFDAIRNEVILSRDRLGIKPLYMWRGNGLIAVASEIKQFRSVPGFRSQLNHRVGMEYLHTGYENPDRSFFEGIEPIRAAHYVRISLDRCSVSPPEEYWHPEQIQVAVNDPKEASHLFSEKLRECVRIHLRSDVPVGCALSGGLDSSAIAVLIADQNNGKGTALRTFTATFPGEAIDEAKYADTIVSAIRALPHKVTPRPEYFLKDLNHFLWVHDEPVGSLSMYAGYCIARLTRDSGVTVTLHGQGGDEILSGYWQSYFLYLHQLWRKKKWGKLAGHFLGALFGGGNPALCGQIPVMMRRYLSRSGASRETSSGMDENLLKQIISLDSQAARVFQIRTMFLPRLLKWDDRNSMAFSVEARYPFLDHELIDLCLSFAPETLCWRGWTKFPLRSGLKTELPPKVRYRKTKFGLETPQDRWLCGPLRPHFENWLKDDRPLWSYVGRERIHDLAQQTWNLNGRSVEPGQALFRALIFDRWLEIFGVDISQLREFADEALVVGKSPS